MIEQRRAIIAPHLNRFTLPELKDYLHEHSWRISRRSPNWETPAYPGFDESTQGIFFGANYKPDGTCCIWGLTRSGEWLLAEVSFRQFSPNTEPRPNICVRKSDPDQIMNVAGINPEVIWYGLAEAVGNWVKSRQKLLDEAKKVEQQMDREFIDWLLAR